MARTHRPHARVGVRDAAGVDRMDKVNDLLRDTIAEVIARELKDPRLERTMLSVTEVRASRDLRNATVLISAMAPPDTSSDDQSQAAAQAIDALNGAAPFVHRTIRRSLRMKRVPWLSFELDQRLAGAAEMQERLRGLSDSGTSMGTGAS